MLLDIFYGLLVGICASVPIGPIAIFVMQKSLSKGHKAGVVAGLGASLVDTIYAVIAIVALAFVQEVIETHQNIILIVGGAVVAALGVKMTFSNPFRKRMKGGESGISAKDFAQAVAMGFSNPGAVFVMFTLFAFFGLAEDSPQTWEVAPIIVSVSAGSVLYWLGLSWAISRFRDRFRLRTILLISRIMGSIIVILGIALLGEGLFQVIFKS